jgi:LPXTG-motif cell wall-anchored protein
MKKVYVLAAALAAVFGALSMGSASFASSGDSVPITDDTVPATNDTVPATDSSTTVAVTDSSTTDSSTTSIASESTDSTSTTTTELASGLPTTVAEVSGVTASTSAVGQEAPTTTIRRVGSDGLLPNTGGDIAIPLILAGLAAGTGAATLLVRRRSNAR